MTKIDWKKLEALQQLEEVDKISQQSPVVIFKHSTRCSISATAIDRLERKWEVSNHPDVSAFYLDVIQHRELSQSVADRYGITHESPQMLVIQDGKCDSFR